jgi:hypothetical protein
MGYSLRVRDRVNRNFFMTDHLQPLPVPSGVELETPAVLRLAAHIIARWQVEGRRRPFNGAI